MSQQQNEQEGMRMMNLIKKSIIQKHAKEEFKTISQQEEVDEGVKFIELIKKGYLEIQQQKQKFQDMIQ